MLGERNDAGFTLIELIVVMTIVGIVAAFAVPSFTNLIRNNQITSTTNSISGLISFARQEAVRGGQLVQVVPAGTDDDWNDGFAVSAGGVDVRVIEDVGPLVMTATRSVVDENGVSAEVNVTGIGFAANGMTGIVNEAGVTPGAEFVVRLCHDTDKTIDGREIIVNAGGQLTTRRGVNCS